MRTHGRDPCPLLRLRGASVSCGAQKGLAEAAGALEGDAVFPPPVLGSRERRGEETGRREEMGALRSRGEAEREFPRWAGEGERLEEASALAVEGAAKADSGEGFLSPAAAFAASLAPTSFREEGLP